MPIIRYLVVVGLALMGLLVGADYLLPKADVVQASQPSTSAVAQNEPRGSLDSWRASQQRHDRTAEAAIVLNNAASLAPTAERLHWEKQLKLIPEGGALNALAQAPIEPPKTVVANAANETSSTPTVVAADTPAPVKKRAKVQNTSRIAMDRNVERDYWGRPVYRETYRQSYGQYGYGQPSWGGRFSFFN